MVKVKICGITKTEEIMYLNKYKPDYMGFIFAKKSSRYISAKKAQELGGIIDGSIGKVGVFVNEKVDVLTHCLKLCRLDVLQLHGDESLDYIEKLKALINGSIRIWKVLRVRDHSWKEKRALYKCADRILLDTWSPDSYGGTGKKFDIELLDGINCSNIIIAGGLEAGNVKEVINAAGPYGVDVSSGVETNGVKDLKKIKQFVDAVRETE